MSDPGPTRTQGDLAGVLEMVLDKGVVVNADIAVSIGDTELLGIELRAAVASFETAAEYGLEFPTGTDMERVEEAAGVPVSTSDTDADSLVRPETGRETDESDGTHAQEVDRSRRGSE